MKVLISADMEGIGGVSIREHVIPDNPEWARFRRLMTAEVNAAIEGALAGGADQVVVNDSHWSSSNILIEDLNPAATLITGQVKPLGQVQGIGSDVSAVFLIGAHAAAGTLRGVLAHTNIRPLVEVSLNGQVMSETGLGAALAGEFGVPVVLVTGDRATTEEAKALLGDIETVTVKEGITTVAAENQAPELVCQKIRQAAQRALNLRVSPFVIQPPITLRIRFQVGAHADIAAMMPGSNRVDGSTVEWVAEDMKTADRYLFVASALSTLG